MKWAILMILGAIHGDIASARTRKIIQDFFALSTFYTNFAYDLQINEKNEYKQTFSCSSRNGCNGHDFVRQQEVPD